MGSPKRTRGETPIGDKTGDAAEWKAQAGSNRTKDHGTGGGAKKKIRQDSQRRAGDSGGIMTQTPRRKEHEWALKENLDAAVRRRDTKCSRTGCNQKTAPGRTYTDHEGALCVECGKRCRKEAVGLARWGETGCNNPSCIQKHCEPDEVRQRRLHTTHEQGHRSENRSRKAGQQRPTYTPVRGEGRKGGEHRPRQDETTADDSEPMRAEDTMGNRDDTQRQEEEDTTDSERRNRRKGGPDGEGMQQSDSD